MFIYLQIFNRGLFQSPSYHLWAECKIKQTNIQILFIVVECGVYILYWLLQSTVFTTGSYWAPVINHQVITLNYF